MEAIRALTPREVPVLVALMAVRSLPALAHRRRLRVSGPILESFRRGGFVCLRDTPDELVFGGIGRFWRADGGICPIEAADFRDFAEPGWAKRRSTSSSNDATDAPSSAPRHALPGPTTAPGAASAATGA